MTHDDKVTHVDITEIPLLSAKDKRMPIDLPDDVAQDLMAMDIESYQSLAHEEEANAQNQQQLIAIGAGRMFEEEDPLEAVTQSRILNAKSGGGTV